MAGSTAVGSLGSPGQKHAEDVAVTPDGQYAFVTYQDSAHVGVFNLQRALSSGFGSAGLVGLIPVGPQPIGIAMAPDGKHAYVASGQDHATTPGAGVLSVIDVPRPRSIPGSAVVMKSIPAGCQTNRMAFSPDGQDLWVTAVGSNALLGLLGRQAAQRSGARPDRPRRRGPVTARAGGHQQRKPDRGRRLQP